MFVPVIDTGQSGERRIEQVRVKAHISELARDSIKFDVIEVLHYFNIVRNVWQVGMSNGAANA